MLVSQQLVPAQGANIIKASKGHSSQEQRRWSFQSGQKKNSESVAI